MVGHTVVIVEDDPLVRFDAVTMLEEAGLDVVEFETADDALSYVYEQSDHVAGVFTDLRVDGVADGLELAETVARQWPHIAVVLTSGKTDPRPDLMPSVTFLPKPWLPLNVLTTMQNAVGAARLPD